MPRNWSDYFADAFTKSFIQSREIGEKRKERKAKEEFERWKAEKMYGGGLPLFGIDPSTGQLRAVGGTGTTPQPTPPMSIPPKPEMNIGLKGFPQTQFGVTSFNQYGRPQIGQTPQSKTEQALFQKQKEADIGLSKELGKETAKKLGQMTRMIGAWRHLTSKMRRVDEEYEGGTGGKAALHYDIAKFRYAPTALKESAAPLFPAVAQREEVSISSLPFLSGQARYVQSLANRIDKTVPDIDIPAKIRYNLIEQSVRNALTLGIGVQKGHLTTKALQQMGVNPDSDVKNDKEMNRVLRGIKLTKDEEQMIEEAIDYVLTAPAAKTYEGYSTLGGAKQTPKVGFTKNGYRFKGGNPADKNSWEKIQ
jgi:hypothetical protein